MPIFSVAGSTPDVGFSPGRGVVLTIIDNKSHLLGCIPPGHSGRLTLYPSTGVADSDVLVSSKLASNYDNSLGGSAGSKMNTADPPMDLSNSSGLGIPVHVQKLVGAGPDFCAILTVTDGSGRDVVKQFPRQVDAKQPAAGGIVIGGSAVAIPQSASCLQNDLLVAFIAVSNHLAADPTVKYTDGGGDHVDAGWTPLGSLDATQDPRIRVYVKLAGAPDPAYLGYKWDWGAGAYTLSGQLLVIRADGAGSLNDYGFGLTAFGIPSIWNGSSAGAKVAVTTTIANAVEDKPIQSAPLNVDIGHGRFGFPRVAVCCLAPVGAVVPAQQFSEISSQNSVDPEIPATHGEFKAGNAMMAAGCILMAKDAVQITGANYFNPTPFTFQGAYLVLGLSS